MVNFITGAHVVITGQAQRIALLILTTSTSILPVSTHRIRATKETVSQFAVLQNKAIISSTSPSVIVENAPLNFVRAGWYRYDVGQLGSNGTDSTYWSNISYNSTNSHRFVSNRSYFSPQGIDAIKGYGFSARCESTKPHI